MSEPIIEHADRLPGTAVGLLPRLISAFWFGAAAFIPIILFFVAFARGGNSSGQSPGGSILMGVWFFLVFPVSAAAFFGFSVGARILDFERKRSASRVMFRGMSVAILSYLAMPASFIIAGAFTAKSQPFGNMASWIVVIFGVGAVLVGWLVVIAGGVAGLLLFWASGKEGLQTIIKKEPRVSAKKAYLLIAAAGLLVLLVNLLMVLASWAFAPQRPFLYSLDRFDPETAACNASPPSCYDKLPVPKLCPSNHS